MSRLHDSRDAGIWKVLYEVPEKWQSVIQKLTCIGNAGEAQKHNRKRGATMSEKGEKVEF